MPAADDGSETPAPDPDPHRLQWLGHGSHVAGTAAGLGVKADHTTYTGPYNANTYKTSFGIGPGVAPKAKLIALKIFGCEGSDGLHDRRARVGRRVQRHACRSRIDVVNMSLGGAGGAETADALASDALVASGVVVVASAASNDGHERVHDRHAGQRDRRHLRRRGSTPSRQYPGATIDRATGTDINGINQNGFPELPVSGTLQRDRGRSGDADRPDDRRG